MSVWFCSDLHFGHKNIQKFRHHIGSEEQNRAWIKNDWHACVTKRDDVYVLGDACFTMETIDDFADLPGRKHLIRGNHDLLDTQVYLKHFHSVYGLLKYKEFWLSHAPIHPLELRGKVNLHGHVHYESIHKYEEQDTGIGPMTESVLDKRYFNCCVENVYALKKRSVISLDEIRNILKEQ